MDMVLGDVCDFVNGGAWSEDEYSEVGIHVVKVTNIEDGTIVARADDFLPASKYETYKQHQLREGDIVVATVGSHPSQPGSVVGRTARVPKDFSESFLNQNAVCLRVKRPDLIDQTYLFYLSKTVLFKHHIESRARGSANQVRMALGELKKFSVSVPHVNNQQKIAAILSAYDELIENNKRRIALLEKMAEEIYREWFVRLRFPGYEKVKNVKGVPTSWRILRFSEVCRFQKGKTPDESFDESQDGCLPYLNVEFLEGQNTEYVRQTRSSIVCEDGDILMLMDGARSGLVFRANRGIVGSTFARIAVTPLYRDFVFEYLRAAREQIVSNNTGSAIPHANKEFIHRLILLLPINDDLIVEFNSHYRSLFEQVENLQSQNRILQRSRDQLLPRLISGKLSVENLDIQFPPSMKEEALMPTLFHEEKRLKHYA